MTDITATDTPAPVAPAPPATESITKEIDNTVNSVVRQATNGDQQRLQMIASLVNVFNFAIQVQTERNNWTEHDTRAFGFALAAIDSIGAAAREEERLSKTHARERNVDMERINNSTGNIEDDIRNMTRRVTAQR